MVRDGSFPETDIPAPKPGERLSLEQEYVMVRDGSFPRRIIVERRIIAERRIFLLFWPWNWRQAPTNFRLMPSVELETGMSLFFGVALVEFRVKERSVSTMIRLGLEYVFLILRKGARLAGGGKVRLGDDPSRTRVISYSKERRSPGWRRQDPSRR